MKKLLLTVVICAATLLLSMFSADHLVKKDKANETKTNTEHRVNSDEKVYTVKDNENVTDIAIEQGVPVEDIISENHLEDEQVEEGDALIIPETYSPAEKDLLARLVNAEAKGESYEGKVAVATVVLNRVESERFPDTVSEVINDKNQFSPVSNGSINQAATEESIDAVNEAIALQEEEGTEATFFYNPDLTNDKWIKSLPVIEVIGNHYFATS